MKYFYLLFFQIILSFFLQAQEGKQFLSDLSVTKNLPLYTTYAAAMERSEFTLDEGYHFLFYDSTRGADFITDNAGDWHLTFQRGSKHVYMLKDMFKEPVITASYSDIVKYTYLPFEDIKIDVTFLVYSSRIAIQEIAVTNLGSEKTSLEAIVSLQNMKRAFHDIAFDKGKNTIVFSHEEPPDSWVTSHNIPHVTQVHDLLLFSHPPDRMSSQSEIGKGPEVEGSIASLAKVISCVTKLEVAPKSTKRLRVIRAVRRSEEEQEKLVATAQKLMREDLDKYVKEDEKLYSSIPLPQFDDSEKKALYWSAFTLMRQVMLPPEGKSSYNYYVFSREPQWGWGHGGQVFHESLTMLAYAAMDPLSAMNSQRVFRERQLADGYINYRTGPYLDETIPYEGQLTTSAPWYAWQNWEVYKISKDKKFLREMYESSVLFYNYYVKNRDSDGDGLCEWGAHAVLECVRDGLVAVWDKVGWPSNFEALDLNCMLVQEEKALSAMALELGLSSEAKEWEQKASERTKKINDTMWDEETGFYYHVDKKNHSFTFKEKNDLKREEIIGFLPLWAGIADQQRAQKLVQKLTDPKKFWRTYGVPSLAADDPYYNPKGYWNGPVWVEWNYLILRGLLDYGYTTEAKELVQRVSSNMIAHLKKDHTFWELYSPDEQWAGHNKTYIWAGLISRMLMDVAEH
ncbi:MAG: hypothetical protein HY088_05610 [Ignavibacteriales bacterium]|nr:hypothetical protein [Ignavibacteriales bacterium]